MRKTTRRILSLLPTTLMLPTMIGCSGGASKDASSPAKPAPALTITPGASPPTQRTPSSQEDPEDSSAHVAPTAPSAPRPTVNDPADRCKIREVDFTAQKYPASVVSDDAYEFVKGHRAGASGRKGQVATQIDFSHTEFGILEGSTQPAAFVYTVSRFVGYTGNLIPPFQVAVFRMDEQCQLKWLGAFEPYPGEFLFEDSAFVVAKNPGREEWRVRGGKMQRTVSTNQEVLATVAPPWKAHDFSALARSTFYQLMKENSDLRALFQATLGKDYWVFLEEIGVSQQLRYHGNELSGSGCGHINCMTRSFFTLSEDGVLHCALILGKTTRRFSSSKAPAPGAFDARVTEAADDIRANLDE